MDRAANRSAERVVTKSVGREAVVIFTEITAAVEAPAAPKNTGDRAVPGAWAITVETAHLGGVVNLLAAEPAVVAALIPRDMAGLAAAAVAVGTMAVAAAVEAAALTPVKRAGPAVAGAAVHHSLSGVPPTYTCGKAG